MNREDVYSLGTFGLMVLLILWYIVTMSLRGYDNNPSAQLADKIQRRKKDDGKSETV